MTIHLVATDAELYKLCRDILIDHSDVPQDWTIVPKSPADANGGADIYIWDFHPNLALPERVEENPMRHLFLVDRNDLAVFHERMGAREVNVLLKPVGRATLTTFLVPAISNGAAETLRADRDEILQCVIQANLKLQEYDQDRTTFLARAVHDFGAPLTALSGYCGLLLSEPLGALSEKQKEVLRRMQQSAKRLSRMATAMLELSVGRQVKRRPDVQPGDIRECLDQALHEIAPFAEEKSISITLDVIPCEGMYFEAGHIEQVFVNIFDNACKFTPKGGAIDVRGYAYFWERRGLPMSVQAASERRCRDIREPNSYRIDISDGGPAIPAENLTRIFEEYTSYSGSRDRSGAGLGLAICKMLVTQHGGRIWAENRESGPLFSIILPIGQPESVHHCDATRLPPDIHVGGRG